MPAREFCGWTRTGTYEHRPGCYERHPALSFKQRRRKVILDGVTVRTNYVMPSIRKEHPDPVQNDNLCGAYKGRGGSRPVNAYVPARGNGNMASRIANAILARGTTDEDTRNRMLFGLPKRDTMPSERSTSARPRSVSKSTPKKRKSGMVWKGKVVAVICD